MESKNDIIGVINRRNGFSANLLRKGLIENPEQRRDKPAQRFRRNGWGSSDATLALEISGLCATTLIKKGLTEKPRL